MIVVDSRADRPTSHAQVTAGPCTSAKPWGWNAIESAKWNSWMQLGDMAALEAMELYVATMEEENPDWWDLVTDNGDPEAVAEVKAAAAEAVTAAGLEAEARAAEEAARSAGHSASAASLAVAGGSPGDAAALAAIARLPRATAGEWSVATVGGKAPRGRYSACAASVGGSVYVVGGNSYGRLTGEVHVLNVAAMQWRDPPRDPAAGTEGTAAAFTPRAGHAAVVWGGRIVVIGGHMKGGGSGTQDACDVWMLDPGTLQWQPLALGGKGPSAGVPSARGGHTATLVHGTNKVVVFGGEDRRGRLLNDVHIIDLTAMEWVTPSKGEVKGAVPTPRVGHVAASLPGRKEIFVFGGSTRTETSGELFALDVDAMTWRVVTPVGANRPAPRAGAAGAVVGDTWFVVGGGDTLAGGRRDTVALRPSPLSPGHLEWVDVASVAPGSSIAAEGSAVVAVGGGGNAALLAFGGYDGKRYSRDVHVMKDPAVAVQSSEKKAKAASAVTTANGDPSGPLVGAAAEAGPVPPTADVAAANQKAADVAATTNRGEVPAMTPRKPAADVASSVLAESRELWIDPNGEPYSVVSAGHESAAHELKLTRRQLASAKAALTEAEKECAAVRAQLSDEQAKTLRLEAQLAELHNDITARATAVEDAGREATRQEPQLTPTKGIWGYIAGSAPEYKPKPK